MAELLLSLFGVGPMHGITLVPQRLLGEPLRVTPSMPSA